MTPLEDVVLIVADDRAVVEADLAAGRLLCPRCRAGVLTGWGCSRLRRLRTREGERRLPPRRGRCRESACGATHVLLPDVCLAGRQTAVEVIGEALLSVEGYRPVAERLGVPAETVRAIGGSGSAGRRREPAGPIDPDKLTGALAASTRAPCPAAAEYPRTDDGRLLAVDKRASNGWENGRTPVVRSGRCESFDDPGEWVEGAIACRDAGTPRSRLFAS